MAVVLVVGLLIFQSATSLTPEPEREMIPSSWTFLIFVPITIVFLLPLLIIFGLDILSPIKKILIYFGLMTGLVKMRKINDWIYLYKTDFGAELLVDLKEVTDTILESFKGIVEEDFEVGFEFTDTVNEITLRSKSDDKVFHVLVLESLKELDQPEVPPEESGGES